MRSVRLLCLLSLVIVGCGASQDGAGVDQVGPLKARALVTSLGDSKILNKRLVQAAPVLPVIQKTKEDEGEKGSSDKGRGDTKGQGDDNKRDAGQEDECAEKDAGASGPEKCEQGDDSPRCKPSVKCPAPACVVGTKQCGTGGVQTCVLVNGCPVFSSGVACAAHTECTGAGICTCIAAPPGCTAVGTFCAADGTLNTCAAAGSCFYVSSTSSDVGVSCGGTGANPGTCCPGLFCDAPAGVCNLNNGGTCQIKPAQAGECLPLGQPACGCDHGTYGDECLLRFNGVFKLNDGPCTIPIGGSCFTAVGNACAPGLFCGTSNGSCAIPGTPVGGGGTCQSGGCLASGVLPDGTISPVCQNGACVLP